MCRIPVPSNILLCLVLCSTSKLISAHDAIAGYHPAGNKPEEFEQALKFTLDQYDIQACKTNFECAKEVYQNGANSKKPNGDYLTYQDIARGGGVDPECATLSLANSYWKTTSDKDYQDKYIAAAIDGDTNPYKDLDKISRWTAGIQIQNARKQSIKKGTAYMTQHYKSVCEFEHAYKSKDADVTDAEAAIALQKVDMGWAYYTGTGESGDGTGKAMYNLQEKRSSAFNVDDSNSPIGNGCVQSSYDHGDVKGCSNVNAKVAAAAQALRKAVEEKREVNPWNSRVIEYAFKCIETQTPIGIIQGCLVYTYKSSTCNSDCGDEWGELDVFCRAALHLIDAANSTAAKVVEQNMDLTAATAVPHGYNATVYAIYSSLNKMGIKCADVGFATAHGDTKENTLDLCNDETVTDYCGFATPVNEAHAEVVTTTKKESSSDWDFNNTCIIILFMLLVCFLILMIMVCQRKNTKLSHVEMPRV